MSSIQLAPVYYVKAGSTFPITFGTQNVTNGASITMTGLAVTDIEIYKDGSTTQRASDNGYTLLDTDGIDIDGITGIHGFQINLADNSDNNFYQVGFWYYVVVSSVTVNSQTVSFVAATFYIEPGDDIPKVDVVRWTGEDIPSTANAGVPEVDVVYYDGSVVPVANTMGVPKGDITHVIGDPVQEDSTETTNWGGT